MASLLYHCLVACFLLHTPFYQVLGAAPAIAEASPQPSVPPVTQKAVQTVLQAIEAGNHLRWSNFSFQFRSCGEPGQVSYVERSLAGGQDKQSLGQRAQWSFSRIAELGQNISHAASVGLKTGLQTNEPEQMLEVLLKSKKSTRTQEQPFEAAKFATTQKDSAATTQVPGITLVAYAEFFTKASAVAVQLLKENFRKAKIDSAAAVAHVPVLGDFQIKLENVQLEGLDLNKSSTGVRLGEDGLLILLVKGLDAVVSGHVQWRRTKFPFISGGCQAVVTAENGNVELRVAVVDDGSGRPRITDLQAAELKFDSLSIHTSGAKLAWLYNAVAKLAKTAIQEAIEREVASQVTTTIPDVVNGLLGGVPTTVDVKGLQLNTSLARSPLVSPQSLVVWDWGRFQNPQERPQECPFERRESVGLLPPTGGPYMLIANLDESIANCLTWDLQKKGMLTHFFVGDDLPQQVLYTDAWRLVIPALYRRCPGCPLALNASVSSAPHTHFDAKAGINSSGTAELSFFLADPEESGRSDAHNSRSLSEHTSTSRARSSETWGGEVGAHMFTLSLSGELTVPELRLERDGPDQYRLFLSMKVNKPSLTVGVVESDIGEINKASLHLALTIAAFLVEDQVNQGILKDGFLLPAIPHIAVERANVTVGDAVLAIGSDLAYAA